ncbi:MAG: NGG1p interacting factor NIF3 [Planctomycetota bacterium]
MLKLCLYVPVDATEAVKRALFAAGAGRIGNYDQACWQCSGTGQFRPLAGSDPTIGTHGGVSRVEELRIEMLVREQDAAAVIAALCEAHPYEEPAYDLTRLAGAPGVPFDPEA